MPMNEDKRRIMEEMEEPEFLTWEPERDKIIVGEVMAYRDIELSDGKRSECMDLRSEEDGETYTVWLWAMIKSFIAKEKIAIGCVIGLKYFGEREGKKNDYFSVGGKLFSRPAGEIATELDENPIPADAY
jgi:hypothetical protein